MSRLVQTCLYCKASYLVQVLKDEKIDCGYTQTDAYVFSEANDAKFAATAVQKEFNAARDVSLSGIKLVSCLQEAVRLSYS